MEFLQLAQTLINDYIQENICQPIPTKTVVETVVEKVFIGNNLGQDLVFFIFGILGFSYGFYVKFNKVNETKDKDGNGKELAKDKKVDKEVDKIIMDLDEMNMVNMNEIESEYEKDPSLDDLLNEMFDVSL